MKVIAILSALLLGTFSLAVAQSSNSNTQFAVEKTTTLKIEEGTLLKVKSLSPISSKTAKEGDVLEFALYEDLIVKGQTLVKEGTLVHALIEESQKAKGVGKQGSLKIQFTYTKAVDGTKVPLRSSKGNIEGENKGGASVALAVVVSPLFLLKKGKEAKIPEGKIMEAYVGRDVEVAIK